ncbi:SNF7_family protein [Hexamita inflata]|uniref:SNF7 family protein n=1 Tax=Hexamita inflata TaxID=28002 RepID=A0AA86R3N2_9EUKA|nr:SNF7 family protein [Hexamita inflata]CAI9968348.1 SNF7 family protein [Hexamita inflata]
MSGMEDFMFNLKFQAKQFKRESDHALKEANKTQIKCRDNLQKGNRDAAQIYAQQVIQQRNFSSRYLQMSVKFDILQSQLKSQELSKNVTKEISKMNKIVATQLEPAQILDSAKTMTQFNELCEQMGVQQSVVQNMMGETAPIGVAQLITQLEEEIATKQTEQVGNVPSIQQTQQVVNSNVNEVEDMQKRLAMM